MKVIPFRRGVLLFAPAAAEKRLSHHYLLWQKQRDLALQSSMRKEQFKNLIILFLIISFNYFILSCNGVNSFLTNTSAALVPSPYTPFVGLKGDAAKFHRHRHRHRHFQAQKKPARRLA
ncbi:hypothetical protein [Acerihabitans arboris]|uniref:Uncharacterized protein n=1 Tax=Acerihabitans arboris TaxID=2691583 RepID=A0A845SKU9_9GAMM|nr:hypothetical protein [Acerihabitans arboris]NDL63594.1 hypothetical protein [Acerihabitans arboris]